MNHLERLEKEISELRNQLISHPLYSDITSVETIQLFMESHIFAVWDFMSLLKALQIGLTNTTLPWTPTGNPVSRRLINEIVLGEESDLNELQEPKSHYEMYLDAMSQLGANTTQIDKFIQIIKETKSVSKALETITLNDETKDFVMFTFEAIETNKLHVIAAVFTFGREDLIPDMFIEIVKHIGQNTAVDLTKLIYYLDRHIEVDGGEHGPMALQMIHELCANDPEKWEEAIEYSKTALIKRIHLWNGVQKNIAYNLILNN
ncbi:MAG: DUF3050 domain-containing protein [Flavobacteriia bacterium]|nr:DUF3050 domain-containing protein [Flavobacteriia bacterium]